MREKILSVTKKDLKIETFKSGGSGGQGRDKRDTAVRITHIPSGAQGSAQDEREQSRNKKLALDRMVKDPKFEAWVRREASGLIHATEIGVDKAMRPENLKIEVREDGKWKEF